MKGTMEDIYKVLERDQALLDAVNFLKTSDWKSLQPSTIILNDRVRIIIMTYETKNEVVYEAHRKQLDMHIVLEGSEHVLIRPIDGLLMTRAYDTAQDYALYEGEIREKVLLSEGDWVLCEVWDAHMPGYYVSVPGQKVKKAVVKLMLEGVDNEE